MSTPPTTVRASDYHDPVNGMTLPANGVASAPVFSPDGKVLFFLSTASNIGVAPAGTLPDSDDRPDIYAYLVQPGINMPVTSNGTDNTPGFIGAGDGMPYNATNLSPAVSPLVTTRPDGSTVYTLAFVTNSDGAQGNGSGIYDLAVATVVLSPAVPFGPQPRASVTSVVISHREEFTAGVTPVFSGDGSRLAYVGGGIQAGLGIAPGTSILVTDATNHVATELLTAEWPLTKLALSHDGRFVAMETIATRFDRNGDGIYDFDFSGTVSGSSTNVYVYDQVNHTMALVDEGVELHGFVPAASAAVAPHLLVASSRDPYGGFFDGQQVVEYTLSATTGALIGLPHVLTHQSQGQALVDGWVSSVSVASPDGMPWVAFAASSDALLADVIGPGAITTHAPTQGFVGGAGFSASLATVGSGSGWLDQDVSELALAPVRYDAVTAAFLAPAASAGPQLAAAYVSTAGNVPGWGLAGQPALYITTLDAPPPWTPKPQILDFTYSDPANPLQQIDINVPGNDLGIVHANGAWHNEPLSGMFGVDYDPARGITVFTPVFGNLVLGPGDDVLGTSSAPAPVGGAWHELLINADGGPGHDAFQAPAGYTLQMAQASLTNFEELRFDPAAAPTDVSWVQFGAPLMALPFQQFVASPGADRISVYANVTTTPLLFDFSAMSFVGFDAFDQLQVSPQGDLALSVVGPATVALLVASSFGLGPITARGGDLGDQFFSGFGNDSLIGGGGDDWFEPRGGNDSIDGGAGDDLARFIGPRAAFSVQLLPGGSPDHVTVADLRPTGGQGIDDVVGVERFRFDDGVFTLAELLGPAGSTATVQAVSASVAESGSAQWRILRTGDIGQASSVGWRLLGSGATPALPDDVQGGFTGGQIALPAGAGSVLVLVPLVNDGRVEADEGLRLELFNPQTGLTLGTPATADLVIANDDHAPVAVADALRTPEDYELVLSAAQGVLANDVDVDLGAVLQARLFTSPAHGLLTLAPDGGLRYVPAADYNGPDSFAYLALDEAGNESVPVVVSIAVSPMNDPPVAQDDAYTVIAGQVLQATSVLANDYDPDGEPLGATWITLPQHGALQFNVDGTFVYTPTTGFTGPDSFRYVAVDRSGTPQSANGNLVAITVEPDILRAPALVADTTTLVEGDTLNLTITPPRFSGDPAGLSYRIDWGDGSAAQVVSQAQLLATQGVLQHLYADDPDGPVNLAALTLRVTVQDAASGQIALAELPMSIQDVEPTASFTWSGDHVEHDAPFVFTLNSVRDVAGDPVLQMRAAWDGGPALPVTVGGTLTARLATLGVHLLQVDVVNDDGSFRIASIPVNVTATAGHATPNGTPAEWVNAWTDSMISFSHLAAPSDPWTPIRLSAVGSGTLAGGDLFGGLLGVSGGNPPVGGYDNVVRQEIQITEALKVELTGGQHANAINAGLARFFAAEVTGRQGEVRHEAGRIQFFDGGALVAERTFRAHSTTGLEQLEFSGLPTFNCVVFTAGAYDSGGVFHDGRLADDSGQWAASPVEYTSDYLLGAVQFLLLGEVAVVGVPGG